MREWVIRNRSLLVAIVVVAAFLVADFLLLSHDKYWLFLLPVVLLGLALFVLRFETGLLVLALLTPFAVNFALLPGMELSMPVEPMMILFSAIFLFRVFLLGGYDRRLLRHPVTLSIIGMALWMLVTSCTSILPDVSFKYWAARLWFIIPFYFAAAQIFRSQQRIRQFVWCYAVSLLVVVFISTIKMMSYLNNLQMMYIVMKPFYNDHTAYGCVIALFIPVTVHYVFSYRGQRWKRLLLYASLALLLVGLFFSYSRAAWISVVGTAFVYVAIRMGVKVRWLIVAFGLMVTAFFTYQSDVLYKLGKNKQDSSLDVGSQVKSISNISTDASNLERLNRWASAMRMFREHPVMGCGPGTYQFLYASYQRSYQLSVISTNAGNRGNAHSEYIGPLTEQGVLGALLMLAIFLTTFATGVRVYRTAADTAAGKTALAFTLSLLTYYVHGIFNNFLDTDKLSVPFWAFTAAVVALDIFVSKKSDLPEKKEIGDNHHS